MIYSYHAAGCKAVQLCLQWITISKQRTRVYGLTDYFDDSVNI